MDPSRYLQWWLLLVAALRFLSVVIALFRPKRLQHSLFAAASDQFTPLTARIFACWTATTGMLCLLCAHQGCRPDSAIYMATALSFAVALFLFVPEVAWHGTMTLGTVASPLIVATSSLGWMLAVRLSHTPKDTSIRRE